MDRNTFTGVFLILIILVGSTFLLKPSEEEIKRERQLQDSAAKVSVGTVSKPGDTAKSVTSNADIDSTIFKGPFGAAVGGEDKLVILENEFLKLYISSKGGRIASAELKGEKTYDPAL